MGLGHWNRRRDSQSSGRSMESSSTQTAVDDDLARYLANLYRRGELLMLNSIEDDDSGDEYMRDLQVPSSVPPADIDIDTSAMDASELKQEMLNDSCTLKSRSTGTPKSSVSHLLLQREHGTIDRSNFQRAIWRSASDCYIPNKYDLKERFRSKVFCGTYSQSGDIFLSACQDCQIRIYDTSNGGFKKFNSIHALNVGWSVLDTSFSPDGRYLVYSSWSDYLHLCDVHGQHHVHQSLPLIPDSEHGFCIFSVVFSQDNKEILGGANDRRLYVYDLERKERTLRVEAHEDDINAVSFADEGSQILFSGSDDGLCKIWDRRTLRESDPHHVGILAGHLDGITFIDSRGDGRYLLSNCKDQSIKLWDMRHLSSKKAQDETRHCVARQNWDYRWQEVPRKVYRNRKRITGDSSLMTYRGHTVLNTLIRARFSPKFTTGQRFIYTGCANGAVVVYDVLTGQIVKTLRGHNACVRDVSWHPYQNTLMSTSWDCTIAQWSYEMDEEDEQVAATGQSNTRQSNSSGSKRRRTRNSRLQF